MAKLFSFEFIKAFSETKILLRKFFKSSFKLFISGTEISAATDGVDARLSAAKSQIVTSVSWPTAEIIGIEDNDVYGKILTIKHNENLISVYSNIKNITAKVGYKLSQGEIIGTSNKSSLESSDKTMLHFEVYYKGNALDPENLYTMSVSDFE